MLKGRNVPVTNAEIANLYCEASIASADTNTYISGLGGAEPSFPSDSGELIRLVSDNSADVGIPIEVTGLNVDGITITEVVILNGLTPVQTTQSFRRLNFLFVLGSTPVQGEVLATNLAADTNYRRIDPATQYSSDGVASIGRDRTIEFDSLYFGITRETGAQTAATVSLHVRLVERTPFFVPFKLSTTTNGSSISDYSNPLPQSFDGIVDVYLTAAVSNANTDVVARLVMLELKK